MGVIDEVKERLDIVEVISQYATLTKAGRNFKALCPFHTEKHPSFFVFPERQSWHCFGSCSMGGDVFRFVMKKENLDFAGALRLLAQRAGVSLAPPKQETEEDKETQRLHQINEVAAQFYHHLLLTAPEAEEVRKYLVKRGVSEKSLEDFELGLSPKGWQGLIEHLTSRGYQEKELLKAGLAIKKEGEGSYDRFRSRLMFPIRDSQGQMAGFGARALDDSMPKYINSPQTSLFDKGGMLYGFYRAKSALRRENQAVIVEGYMDVILAHQYSFENVVGSMGVALSEKQIDLLKRYTKNLTLALDPDAAGKDATLRGVEIATRALDHKVMPVIDWQGLVKYESVLDAEVRVILLPQDKDPDEVIRENPQIWKELAGKALPVVDFAIETITSKLDLAKAKDKSHAVEQLLPFLGDIKDPVRRAHYLQKLARLVKVEERTLAWELRKLLSQGVKGKATEQKARPKSQSNHPEEYCLALLLQCPEVKDMGFELSPEYFEESENRELFLAWCSSPEGFQEKLEAPLQERRDYLLALSLPPASPKERERTLADCSLRLREKYLRSQEAKKKEILLLETETEGTAAGLAKLQELGVDTGTRLQEVFVEQNKVRRTAFSKE